MKIKEHPALHWERWLLPLIGTHLPQDDLDHAILKAATCHAPKSPVPLDSVELTLEQSGKTIMVSQPVRDPHFAQRLCAELQHHCIGKTVTEIGERNAP
jgi:hypothetical protein